MLCSALEEQASQLGQHGCQPLGQLRATGFYFHVGGWSHTTGEIISHFGKLHKRWVI